MKKYIYSIAILTIIFPSIAMAAWWNPTSWFNNWKFPKKQDKTEILENRIKELEKKLDNSSTTSRSFIEKETLQSEKTAKTNAKISPTITKNNEQAISENKNKLSNQIISTPIKTVKTWTLPNGAVIDEAGNIISQPTNSNPITITQNLQAGQKVISSEEIYSLVSPSVVVVLVPDGHGSGFIINDGKYTVTNWHVVYDDVNNVLFKNAIIKLSDGRSFTGPVLGANKDVDLAIIYNGDVRPVSLKLGTSNSLNIGSDVFALGYPEKLITAVTFTKGTLSAKQNVDFYNGGVLLQMDAAINHGNSGGPLVNNKGEVVGINTFGYGENTQGLFFAIPIDTLKTWIPALSQDGQSRYEINPIGSTLTIKKSIQYQIDLNTILSCGTLGFVGTDFTTCDLYKNYKKDYHWVINNDL